MPELTDDEVRVLSTVLRNDTFQRLIGAEELDLSESDEMVLWEVILKFEKKT